MSENVLLDTSALLAYFQGEVGSEKIREILYTVERGERRGILSGITLTELRYIITRESGEDTALRVIHMLRATSCEIVFPGETICLLAGQLKAAHHLSLGDAIIAATAQIESALLVHRDGEFLTLKAIVPQIELKDS